MIMRTMTASCWVISACFSRGRSIAVAPMANTSRAICLGGDRGIGQSGAVRFGEADEIDAEFVLEELQLALDRLV